MASYYQQFNDASSLNFTYSSQVAPENLPIELNIQTIVAFMHL